MVSIKDIAEACGVSTATVSKALNDAKDISAKRKEMVLAKARELGYHPNSAAKALKTKRTWNLGVLFISEDRSGLTHDYFAHVLDSFKRTAESYGYDITFVNCSKDRPNRMTYLEHARYRSFDGVVAACVDFNDPEVTELLKSDIPCVTIDYVMNGCMSICSNNVKGMTDLLTYIYDMGHRKIAYIHGTDSVVTRARLTTYYRFMEEHGIEVPDEYTPEAPYRSTSRTEAAVRQLLVLKEPPTCIICPDDFAALGAINACNDLHLRIGTDISLAGYDGIPISRRLEPKLTTIRQDTDQVGTKAAEKLIDLIERPKTTFAEQIILESQLVEGGSVAKL